MRHVKESVNAVMTALWEVEMEERASCEWEDWPDAKEEWAPMDFCAHCGTGIDELSEEFCVGSDDQYYCCDDCYLHSLERAAREIGSFFGDAGRSE